MRGRATVATQHTVDRPHHQPTAGDVRHRIHSMSIFSSREGVILRAICARWESGPVWPSG